MNRRKKPRLPFFIGSIICFFSLLGVIVFFPPTILMLSLFLSILFLFCFSTGSILFKEKKYGLLIGFFVIAYLLLHLNNLAQPFFVFLLVTLFLMLFLFLRKKG